MEQEIREKRIRIIPPTKEMKSASGPTGRKKRVAAYCRVSTDSEDQLTSYTSQKAFYTKMIDILRSGKINNRLLCEIVTHSKFHRLLVDIEVYPLKITVTAFSAVMVIY